MTRLRFFPVILLIFSFSVTSCKKDPPKKFPPRQILYLVKGSHFTLNFIDSNSVFQSGKVFTDSFRYQFKKGPGARIGVSIFAPASDDHVSSWNIYIDGKLVANAFSEGGAYMDIPYN